MKVLIAAFQRIQLCWIQWRRRRHYSRLNPTDQAMIQFLGCDPDTMDRIDRETEALIRAGKIKPIPGGLQQGAEC